MQMNSSMENDMSTNLASSKSSGITLVLCLLFGMLGIHRFYVGKIGTGILMLITGGGFGIWVLVDLILIVTNKFEDKQGNILELTKEPSGFKKAIMVVGSIIVWLFISVATFMALVFYVTSGLVDTVRNQLDALRAGDIQKAYSYTAKDFQKVTSLSDFEKFLDQYPSLKNNKSSSFSERQIENNMGTLKGTLTAEDGAQTPIEYRLIKEDDSWKILGISAIQTGTGIEIKHNGDESSNNSLTNMFDEKNNKYSIKYPASWMYEQPEKETVIFSGKKGTSAFYSTVNIQTVLSKKSGGKYSTVEEFIDSLKSQISEKATNGKILDQGKIELPQNPMRFHGEYLVFTYTLHGEEFKQMQFVIARDDGLAFYAWAYTSPEKQYNENLPIAKGMYETWEIK